MTAQFASGQKDVAQIVPRTNLRRFIDSPPSPQGVVLFNPWLEVALKATQLCVDAQSVVALRMIRLAAGGARAQGEAQRMVVEKVAAIAEAQAAAITAALNGHQDHVIVTKTLGAFDRRVRANKRRLSRS
jgi:hypothetical protein